jgi:hypothetical protein
MATCKNPLTIDAGANLLRVLIGSLMIYLGTDEVSSGVPSSSQSRGDTNSGSYSRLRGLDPVMRLVN